MRPIPHDNTKEAWFLRPNLEDRYQGPFIPAPTGFGKQSPVKMLPGIKPLYQATGKVLITVRNETFYSNKFSKAIYTYNLKKTDKVAVLFLKLAQTLMVDETMFNNTENKPEGFNVFLWVNDTVKGTIMTPLDGNKTLADYQIDKNSELYLKYRCRGSKY